MAEPGTSGALAPDQVLSVEKLGKRYRIGTRQPRELWALRDVSFTANAGTILGIIGPNGAGKTTLLKVLSRVTPPSEGRVRGRGRVVPLLALGAGFQADLSARDNVFLNAATYGIPASEVEKRMDEIVEFAGLGDFMDMPVRRYSSGMYLRLAFSVAINMHPDILLADEVLAVGDLEFQERCLERVQQAGKAGMCVLFVSHDMEAIQRLCDRVLWLNAGEIVQMGAPDEIVSAYQSSAWSLSGRRLGDKRSGSHKNEHAELLYVKLTTLEGREIGAVRRGDEMLIRVGIRFDRAELRARITLHVHARGHVAFRAQTREDHPIEQSGIHVISARIPANLLADTVYTVHCYVNILDPNDQKTTVGAHNALSFQVFDPASRLRDNLGGVVAPQLDWSFELERATDPVAPVAG